MKRHYQLQLSKLLADAGWEVLNIDEDTEWWSAQEWTVASRREGWGKEIRVNFLVDPQYEGIDKFPGVWAVGATLLPPSDRHEAESGIVVDLVKGQYQARLESFVASISQLRAD